MRYIDLDLLRGPADFEALITAADEAQQLVEDAAGPAARKALLTQHRQRWVGFRTPFEALVGEKCWYTESRNPGTDDDVDHFRPKSHVTECPAHGGYWWEAFNWRNFRLSSHRSNRLRGNPETGDTHGKGNHFPLLNEADRWMSHTDACHERPSLLDPTNPLDPPMLTFGVDGRAALAPDYDDVADAPERIEASRTYLHLDWPSFVEARTALYGRIATRVDDGERLAAAALDDGEPAALEALKAVARDLIRLTDPREPFSKAALAYIRVYRDKPWLRRMVLGNIHSDAG